MRRTRNGLAPDCGVAGGSIWFQDRRERSVEGGCSVQDGGKHVRSLTVAVRCRQLGLHRLRKTRLLTQGGSVSRLPGNRAAACECAGRKASSSDSAAPRAMRTPLKTLVKSPRPSGLDRRTTRPLTWGDADVGRRLFRNQELSTLLADTEGRKDAVQDIVRRGRARDGVDGTKGRIQIDEQHFVRDVEFHRARGLLQGFVGFF